MNKQFVLNTLVVLVSVLVMLFVGSWAFRLSPFYLIVLVSKLAIYIFGVTCQFILPFLTGIGIRKFVVEWLDDHFGESDDHIPGWALNLLGLATGIMIGMFFTWATPYVALIPTFSVWPAWEFFRWTAHQGELIIINYWLFAWSAITSAVGYFVANDEIQRRNR